MCACVRITASSLPAVHASQLRRRSSLRPWNRPASIRTRLPDAVVSRWREPVTVCAAPRNVSEATAGECHIVTWRGVSSPPMISGSLHRLCAELAAWGRTLEEVHGAQAKFEDFPAPLVRERGRGGGAVLRVDLS